MPRIRPVQVTEAEAGSRRLLESIQRTLGMVPNLLKTMAQSPAVAAGYVGLHRAMKDALTPSLREQLRVAVAGMSGSRYCASAHIAFGAQAGVAIEELAANLRGQSGAPRTRAALGFARELVDRRGHVSDEALADVRAAGFSEPQIVEIVAVVSMSLFANYLDHVARTEIDFPLPDVAM